MLNQHMFISRTAFVCSSALFFMRKIVFILFLLPLVACVTNKTSHASAEEKPVRIANDELEYEVIVFDIGFNRFLNTLAKPRGFYSITNLEIKNQFFISSYNIRANSPSQYGDIYGPSIDYQNHIRYGYEVNYLLYNYFLFFQQKYRQRL